MFREICTLISGLTGFAIGTTIQAGRYAQNAPVRCALVQESGGATHFYPNEDMVDAGIQILTRAESYTAARDDAWTAFRALHGTSGWNMPRLDGVSGEDYLVATVEALASPQYLGEDDNRRHLFSVNFVFRVQDGSCEELSGS
jgi:hypothetical protein